MTPNNFQEQLTKYLTDAHSIEEQALAQMGGARASRETRSSRPPSTQHLTETEEHERLVRERLEARDAARHSSRTWPAR